MARRPKPKLVKLKPPVGDGALADTLLFVLSNIRSGRVKAFSIAMVVETEDGRERTMEAATAQGDDAGEMLLLGAMRMAEHGLVERRRRRKESE